MARKSMVEVPIEKTMEEKIAFENLFVLEFAVDKLTIFPHCDCEVPSAVTYVQFEVSCEEPVDYCETRFTCNNTAGNKTWMQINFSLSESQIKDRMQTFDVYVMAYKKMPLGWNVPRAEIGMARVSILKPFCELINCLVSSPNRQGIPTPKCLCKEYTLEKMAGDPIAKIQLSLKLSSFYKCRPDMIFKPKEDPNDPKNKKPKGKK
ncbi:unnamed protein product [Phyllotreta striolata]|uniref:Uncharacterized protein n=1 Tax=Phyllotreta striolata TaxID=444603 RepID=A0A9N9XRV6_PHYSR|nr:unnamed protein product [Phyllotreta striolata]